MSNGQPMSRVLYIVLGVVVGMLGVHNFLAKQQKPGMIKLGVSLGGFVLSFFFSIFGLAIAAMWIWAIYEVITIKADGNGVAFA
jgi:hypothetical protein